MDYIVVSPSLLCGLALCVCDIRTRRVPRTIVSWGMFIQLMAFAFQGIAAHPDGEWRQTALRLVVALGLAVVSTAVQLALALCRPGALGMGDVTCTALMSLAVGWFGPSSVAAWWVAMGTLGLAWMALWSRWNPQRHTPHADKVPFVPAIVLAAVCAMTLFA